MSLIGIRGPYWAITNQYRQITLPSSLIRSQTLYLLGFTDGRETKYPSRYPPFLGPPFNWREAQIWKTGGRREGRQKSLPCLNPFVQRHSEQKREEGRDILTFGIKTKYSESNKNYFRTILISIRSNWNLWVSGKVSIWVSVNSRHSPTSTPAHIGI